MDEFYSRTYRIFGDNISRIISAKVCVIGLGGVGGSAAEALARAGVGSLVLFDGDFVVESNLNRQAFAFRSTLGMSKCDAAARILRDINPDINLELYPRFWTCTDEDAAALTGCDFILDCADSVKDKVNLICKAHELNIPIISAMGAGNKRNPAGFKVSDISKTSVDPLARVVRRELKERGITHTLTVFSEETPVQPFASEISETKSDYVKRNAPGSLSYVPTAMGLVMAGEVVNRIAYAEM